jgi:hypothetical protein
LLLLAQQGQVPLNPKTDAVNLHCHTFFSFNAYGHSPSSLAWIAKRNGFGGIGIVDFDVLEAVDEFLNACDLAGVCGSTGMETRVFIPEFGTREINSPGEPGISYHMGLGFTSRQVPEAAASVLLNLRNNAARRNREIVKRVNAYLDPVTIDYEQDVLPLTPSGNATERHLLAAYMTAAKTVSDPVGFWADRLQVSHEQVAQTIGDAPKFQNMVRLKLIKRGGVGYIQPTPDSFPTVEQVNQFAIDCGALPCLTWLDGTSAGEQKIEELVELLMRKGVAAINIIPDRNWNIVDPETRRLKVQKLHEVVRLAEQLSLPVNIGTEMNTFGQRLIDDFNAPELVPVRKAFLDGAHFIYGHTVLQRTLGLGYQSDWAKAHLAARRERVRFYTELGTRVQPGKANLDRIRRIDPMIAPKDLLAKLNA